MAYNKNSFKSEWINEGITDATVEWSNEFGEYLQKRDFLQIPGRNGMRSQKINGLSTSQIRKFFGEVKRIQADFERNRQDIPLLKVKLAYAVGRDRDGGHPSSKIGDFYQEVSSMLESTGAEDPVRYSRFVKILESIIAFHKFHGGK